MFTRTLIVILIAMLALPISTLTPHAATSHWSGSHSAVAAKGKNHKNKTKPKSRTVTRTVRGPVTQTFIGTEPITIPGASGAPRAHAAPYPSAITVSGLTNGTITDVNLILNDFTNSYPEDVNVLLSSTDGRRALVMSNVGGTTGVTDIDLTLDDEAAASLPSGPLSQLSSGTFRPTDINLGGGDDFDAPAPALNGNVALSTFDGADPNGTWQLWVMDVASNDNSDIGGGWALEITAEVDAGQVEEKIPVAKDRKHKKQGKGRR